ncbi:class I SAM-dependent methyltransferase [Streptomyces boninensis]|uniref:class I SAM-dependent methyltransferase n=1 Tax=Streptomyces boninensis TaxID=2039455 RepID=UPI003B21504D
MAKEYLFDTASEHGAGHMDHMSAICDPPTVQCLQETGVEAGWRCLDLGAGGGSITRWLAERVGPRGRVVAVDLVTEFLDGLPGVEVHRHDINDGLPDEGPYDLIHARHLLIHLPRREEVLKELVAALAPGGWLVTGDVSARKNAVLAAPSHADRELFERMQYLSHEVVAPLGNMRFAWAHEAYGQMAAAGLADVRAREYSQTMSGGTPGCLLSLNLNLQAEAPLKQAGATDAELRRYRELMTEPGFEAWFYQYVCTSGRKPA